MYLGLPARPLGRYAAVSLVADCLGLENLFALVAGVGRDTRNREQAFG